MFGAAVGSGGSGGTGGGTPPDNSGGTGDAPERDCATYTVKEGDTLSSIATDFDIEGYYVDNVLFDGYQKIYQLNMVSIQKRTLFRKMKSVIIVRIVYISSFLFYCLFLNHSFPTNPNRMTNCFKLILSLFTNFTKLHLLNAFVYFLIF